MPKVHKLARRLRIDDDLTCQGDVSSTGMHQQHRELTFAHAGNDTTAD